MTTKTLGEVANEVVARLQRERETSAAQRKAISERFAERLKFLRDALREISDEIPVSVADEPLLDARRCLNEAIIELEMQ